MNFLELAANRHSVRDYLDKPVEDALIMQILEAGRLAPSACNNQPWFFIVLKDIKSKRLLGAAYNRNWFINAPVIIAICCDRSNSWHRSDGKDYGDVDIAIAMDHITLAATDLGLGTCWIGAFKEHEARQALKLPAYVDPVAFTPVGYSSEVPRTKNRKGINDIVFWEYFGGKKE
ncbi:MAG: nitroreductase [Fibrobacter sp.]|nr:nitroreductase [Fibrobacter sp.]